MNNSWHGGKGSKPRPIEDKKQFENNWDKIFGKKPEKQDERKRKPTPKGQQPVEKE
jgi:hypothetical protein